MASTSCHPGPVASSKISPAASGKVNPFELLRLAKAHYDAAGSPLPAAVRVAAKRGFSGGASWMALALSTLRDRPVALPAGVQFDRLGFAKYLASTCAAVLAAVFAYAAGLALLAPFVAIFCFYAIEVQGVFLFPLAIDGCANPCFKSRQMLLRSAGTFRGVCTVIPIAFWMLFGGLFGNGFLRSWAIGCLAVCIWYEMVKTSDRSARRTRWEFAAWQPLLVREESVRLGDGPNPRESKLLYISDLHLGRRWTCELADEIAQIACDTQPDAILLGGDLVDARPGLSQLAGLLRSLVNTAPVYAVDGNHDRRFDLNAVRECVGRAGATWLDSLGQPFQENLHLHGSIPSPAGAAGDPFSILCTHDPASFTHAMAAGFSLILAGHLHGGQCVLYERAGRLFPGVWINRWTGLRFDRGSATMLVSRGAGDTLPFRWNCPREVLLCRIQH